MKFTTPRFGRRRANIAPAAAPVSVKIDEDSACGGHPCAPSNLSTSSREISYRLAPDVLSAKGARFQHLFGFAGGDALGPSRLDR
jgi:hypothetical protein